MTSIPQLAETAQTMTSQSADASAPDGAMKIAALRDIIGIAEREIAALTPPSGSPTTATGLYTAAQLLGEECAICGNDLAYADGQRPHSVTADGQQLNACVDSRCAPTAEQRGPEWMALYGCTPFCVMDHTAPQGNPGWHQGPTAELMAPAHFSSQLSSEPLLPLLSARVNTTNQDAEIFGVRTSLWVDVADDTLELTVAETDQLIEALVQGVPKLRALRAQLVEAGRGDRPENPAMVAMWRAQSAEQIRLRRIELGELPAEAQR